MSESNDRPSHKDLLDLYEQLDENAAEVARKLGRSPSTVKGWLKDAQDAEFETNVEINGSLASSMREAGLDPEEFEIIAGTVDTNSGRIWGKFRRKLSWMAARVDGWKIPEPIKVIDKGDRTWLCISDPHAPLTDEGWFASVIALAKEFKPDNILVNGDLLENADISRWQDRDGEPTAKESIDGGYYILLSLRQTCPKARIVLIDGNHDEVRINNYMANNAPKLAGLARAEEETPVLSLPFLLRLDELGVEYIGDYPLGSLKISEKFIAYHGKIVKKGSGTSALANLEKRGVSTMTAHTHRAAIVYKTVFDIDNKPETHVAVELGTGSTIKPVAFDEAPDWQNFAATVTVYDDECFHVEPAIYTNGSMFWRDKRFVA